MTIIFNFCCFGAAIISLISSVKLYYNYWKVRLETLRSFALAFLCVTFAYIILSLPQLILFDPVWIQVDFVLVDIFFLGAIYFFTLALLEFIDFSHFKKIFSITMFTWILIYTFLNVIFFSPALPLKSENIIYYWISGTLWLQTISRGLMVLGALVIASTFLKGMKKQRKKILFWRSFGISVEGLLIAIAGFIFWFFPWFYFSPFLLILSGCIGLTGFLLGSVIGIVFRPPREKFVKKIT